MPQGTVLGPILLFMFISDLHSGSSSPVKLFADDSVLFQPIQSPADHHILQQDLFRMEKWASIWQMRFSPTKCYRMSITPKGSPFFFLYMLSGTVLEGVIHQKYLGVSITCTLSWSKPAWESRKKASRVLGFLQRNLSSCNPAVK